MSVIRCLVKFPFMVTEIDNLEALPTSSDDVIGDLGILLITQCLRGWI